MKLSGSTFVWLAGIGVVWAISPVQAAEPGRWTRSSSRFAVAARPAVASVGAEIAASSRTRSVDQPRLVPALLRPDRQRAARLETARCPVERVRITRAPTLHRPGTEALNRFVFRCEDRDGPGR